MSLIGVKVPKMKLRVFHHIQKTLPDSFGFGIGLAIVVGQSFQ